MYARTVNRPKQRRSQLKSFPAPIAGWIANRALAVPNAPGVQQGAAVLDNFFPTSTSVQLRRGKFRYAILGTGSKPCLSLFSYNNGLNQRLFAANDTTIYDVTEVPFPYEVQVVSDEDDVISDADGNIFAWGSTEFFNKMSGFTGGNWIVAQYATTGGVYLIGVNGKDIGFLYDGDNFYPSVEGGVYRLLYDAEISSFTEGSVITGGTSGATATIYRNILAPDHAGELWLTDLTGSFEDNEAITDPEGGAALADGVEDVAAPGITLPGGLTTADMSYVWTYKSRLWFAQNNTLNAFYLDVDSVGGEATIFPLVGIFGRGGSLLFGHNWSLEAGDSGGLSEQCVFVTDEGEVAIYQGDNPDEAATWGKVGVYRIGKPLGNRAFFKGGGDIAIATSVGLIPLSKAISLDVTALNAASVSYNIADAWSDATELRGLTDWQAEVWPELKMAVIAPPHPVGVADPIMFVANTDTGAWGRFTGWHGLCLEVFNGKLYFGSPDGLIYIANQTGQDDGQTYSGTVLPLFDDFGSPASAKIPTAGRAVVRASTRINDLVQFSADFDVAIPTPPDATPIGTDASIWDIGVWGASKWGTDLPSVISQDWRSLSGIGYAGSISLQITSGAIQPLDAEVVRMELMYTQAEMMT